MSSKVMTKDAVVTCKHGGKATLASSEKLTVGGKPAVMCQADLLKAQITGCALQSAGGAFDQSLTAVSAGASQKLTVGKQPVLLDSLKAASQVDAACACTDAGQAKLTAN